MIASVSMNSSTPINAFSAIAGIADFPPFSAIAGPLAEAEDRLARLDERLAKSPIREGWIARTHFADACAALWLDGEAVHIEDLVLNDAGRDVRAPTHELTRARAALSARRRIAASEPDWALSEAGIAGLRGRAGGADRSMELPGRAGDVDEEADDDAVGLDGADELLDADLRFADAFAAVDSAMAKANRVMAEDRVREVRRDKDPLIHDSDWDEDARLGQWRALLDETGALPPTLEAAILIAAWGNIAPLEREPWLGRLLVAARLRQRGKTRAHLACLAEGFRAIPFERRRTRDPHARLVVALEAMTAAAELGLEAHERWLMARTVLSRKLAGRRASSHLPALVDYVLTRPIVSAGMIASEIGITPRAAQTLVAELGLREATGRSRYRAWGIL